MNQKHGLLRLFLAFTASILGSTALTCCATGPLKARSFSYSPELFATEPFIAHIGKTAMKSYLAINIRFAPIAELRQRLETDLSTELKYRLEAHITVITPVEFDKVLSKKISIFEINALAEKSKIQSLIFKPICIGKGSQQILSEGNSVLADTYFAVVSSDELFRLRLEIQKLFVRKGGNAKDFNPDKFFPHITLGFTHRDLHLEDGVIKDESTCVYRLHQ